MKLFTKLSPFLFLLMSGCTMDQFFKEELPREKQEIFKEAPFKIRVIAPASSSEKEKLETLYTLNQLIASDLVYSEEHPPFHSNTDEKRAEDFIDALNGEERIIWAIRGGYGSARIIPYIKPDDLDLAKKKILIGYSDITALHLLFNKYKIKTIHGTVLIELLFDNKDPLNTSMVLDILSGKRKSLTYDNIIPINAEAASSIVEGELIGGNITLVTNSIGTNWQMNAKGKIIFLEDTGVKGYALDRDLNHLVQTGMLDGAKAILFGTFEQGDEWIDFAVNRFAQKINIPVYQSDQFGHGEKNYPLVFGTKARIQSGELHLFNTKF